MATKGSRERAVRKAYDKHAGMQARVNDLERTLDKFNTWARGIDAAVNKLADKAGPAAQGFDRDWLENVFAFLRDRLETEESRSVKHHQQVENTVCVLTVLEQVRDAILHGSLQKEKLEQIQRHNDLLVSIDEGIKATYGRIDTLVTTMTLLVAKGPAKERAPKEKSLPAKIVENANEGGKDIAAEQRAAQGAPPTNPPPAATTPAPATSTRSGALSQPSVAAPSPDPEQKPAPQLTTVPTLDELRPRFLAFVDKHGRERSVELLKSFGAGKLSDIAPKDYPAFAEKLAV